MIQILKTKDGLRFGVNRPKPSKPAPTLFNFGARIEEVLENKDFNKIGMLLEEHGFISVTLDAPCHGEDARPGEPTSMPGWRYRLEQGMPLVSEYNRNSSALLDHLIREGYTDPNRVALAGTSRGGFLALHWASVEPRLKATVAYAPVVDLRALTEFKGMEDHAGTIGVSLENHADKLAGHPIWICIGNNDQRVSTDNCIRFTRKVVAVSFAQGKPAPVEIHVMQTEGHAIHPAAHDESAAWMLRQVGG